MAIRKAVATGNWSATATWDGGTIPSLEDTVYANGYTVTIDQAIDLTGSAVDQSGSFIPGHIYEIVSLGTTNFALTANAIVPGTNATTAVAVTAAIGTIFQAVNSGTATTGTARRVGALLNYVNTPISVVTGGGFTMSGNHNITGAYIQAGSANCLTFTSTATSTLAGCRATGSAFNLSTRAISYGSTGTLTLDGIIALGGRAAGTTAANGAHAIENTSTGTIDIINASTLTGGSIGGFALALNNNSTGNVTVTSSTITGGGGAFLNVHALNNNSTGNVTVTSSAIIGGGSSVSGVSGINNASTGSITITSCTLTGGSSLANYGLNNASAGTITVTTSTLTGGSGTNAHGLNNASTGTIVSTGDITATNSAHGLASPNTAASVKVSGSFIGSANGTAAIYASKFLVDPTPATAKIRQAKNGTTTYSDFFTADNSLGQAAPADVRSGTVYADGNLTGTCAVPAAGSVSLGVPVDAGFGTAVLTPEAVWGHASRTITEGGITAADVWNAATRTITGGTVDTLTTAPSVPSASAIADEVRVELATELARIDAPISGAGNAPSASTVATAVRTELATELAHLDADISTRLADADYVAPANSDVAAVKAVTDALVVERLNNTATTAIVGNLIAQANS